MNTSDCVLALDFDGVVWDSVGESYFIACRTWEKLFSPLPPGLEKGFRAGRWLVRTGHDFYVLLDLLKDDPARDLTHWSKDDFKAAVVSQPQQTTLFNDTFYALRDEERSTRPQHWLSLQPPFPHFMTAFPALRQAFLDIVITTTKDEASVRFLLQHAGIELPVLGKEFTIAKEDQVRWLSQSRKVPLAQIILIDDLLDNLHPVRSVGCQVALATWGYNTQAEHHRAQAEGIPLIHPQRILEDLQAALACG